MTSEEAPSQAARRAAEALLVGVLAALLYLAVALSGPKAVGLLQDDTIYLSTAQALAEGEGYRHIEIPGEPLQTKYPVLYPAILALGFQVGPEYPANLPLLLAPTAIAAAVFVALAFVYLRRVFEADALTLWAVTGLTVVSPVILSLVRFVMSDLLYAAIATGALLILDTRCDPESRGGSARGGSAFGWSVSAGLLIGLALLCRSIGITLAVAAPVGLWLRGRRADALRVLVVIACFALPWIVWQRWAAGENGALQTALLESPELRYALFVPDGPLDTLRVFWQNIFRTAFGMTYFQLALPPQLVLDGVAELGWRSVVVHLVGYASLALVVVGFVQSARTRWRILHLYALLYGGLVLAWPFLPSRFLIPFTPFLLFFLLRGWQLLFDKLGVRRMRAGLVEALLVAPLAVLFLHEALRIAGSTEDDYHLRIYPMNFEELREAEAWIARHTRPDDVIASAHPGSLFLETGRQGYYFWPDSDPYRLYYGPDRSWSSLFTAGSRTEYEHVVREMRREFGRTYKALGVDYFIEHRDINVLATVLGQTIRAQPKAMERRFETSGGTFVIYRIRDPRALDFRSRDPLRRTN